MINRPFDYTVDYFAVLGVHYGASEAMVKKAYRRMARRYHPDVSKIHGAKEKFQEIAEAYEILRKYRDAYCRQFSPRQSSHSHSTSEKQTSGFHYDSKTQSSGESRSYSDFRNSSGQKSSEAKQESRDSEGSSKWQFDWDFEQRFSRSNFHKPIDGKDRWIEYPLTLRYAIRQLKIGSFYIPGLKIRMKFTRQAFEGKTFRIEGMGYRGLFGGQSGDFFVKFEIRVDEERFVLKGGDIYGKFYVIQALLKPGKTVMLDTPSGRIDLRIPEDYQPEREFCIQGMGLPADDENEVGDLYLKLYPRPEINPEGKGQENRSANVNAHAKHEVDVP